MIAPRTHAASANATKRTRVLYRAAVSRRKKLHIPDASSITAGAVRDGTMLGIVFGALPKFAAALSVAISSMQLYNMLRNAWRKRRKGRKKPPPRCKRCGSRWHTSCADSDSKPRKKRHKERK
jgi:hypothetical protein